MSQVKLRLSLQAEYSLLIARSSITRRKIADTGSFPVRPSVTQHTWADSLMEKRQFLI